MPSRSASAVTPARAADSRAAASGSLSAHARGGGGPVTGWPGWGSRSSLSARARSTAACHCSSWRRPTRWPNPFSAARACGLAGMASAASTMAAAGDAVAGLPQLPDDGHLPATADLVHAGGAPPGVLAGLRRRRRGDRVELLPGPVELALPFQLLLQRVPEVDQQLDVEGGVAQ